MSVESPQFRDRRPGPVVRDFDPPMADVGLLAGYPAPGCTPGAQGVGLRG